MTKGYPVRNTGKLEKFRVTEGKLASTAADGMNGAFMIPCGRVVLRVLASDGYGWRAEGIPGPEFEHVSVSLPARCPTWDEMDFVKRLFWRDDECVMQLHVPRDEHVNRNETVLHLWKPIGVEIPRPPAVCV